MSCQVSPKKCVNYSKANIATKLQKHEVYFWKALPFYSSATQCYSNLHNDDLIYINENKQILLYQHHLTTKGPKTQQKGILDQTAYN